MKADRFCREKSYRYRYNVLPFTTQQYLSFFFRKKLLGAIKNESRSKMKKSMDDIFDYAQSSWTKRTALKTKNEKIGIHRKSAENSTKINHPSSTPFSLLSPTKHRVTPIEWTADPKACANSSSVAISVTPINLSSIHASVTNSNVYTDINRDAFPILFNNFPTERSPFQLDSSSMVSMLRSTAQGFDLINHSINLDYDNDSAAFHIGSDSASTSVLSRSVIPNTRGIDDYTVRGRNEGNSQISAVSTPLIEDKNEKVGEGKGGSNRIRTSAVEADDR